MSARELAVSGRHLAIRNLERVVFPQTGTTKGELLAYYASIGEVMLPHLRERLLHMHRYPEGVEGPRFWQKGCPEYRPEWMPVAPVWSREKGEHIEYCVVNELAGLLWAVNIGSIELHTSLHLRQDLHRPTVLAFDLDPGERTTILHCCEVALRIRELFAGMGLDGYPKTSGSKGLQVYVPLGGEVSYEYTKPASRRIAEHLEAQAPDEIVSRIARTARAGRVLIDWSQNTEHKSMVCVYSVRAKQRPTVSTPITWNELEGALEAGEPHALTFEMGDVRERVAKYGDLFAPVLSQRQELPGANAQRTLGGGGESS
jgi:bifunctional non-homologous end joining protein LigD